MKSFLVYKFTCAIVVLATVANFVVILKLELRKIYIRTGTLIFLHMHTPPQYALTHMILFFQIIDNTKSKFDSKIKEDLHINWIKANLNAQQNNLALTFSL